MLLYDLGKQFFSVASMSCRILILLVVRVFCTILLIHELHLNAYLSSLPLFSKSLLCRLLGLCLLFLHLFNVQFLKYVQVIIIKSRQLLITDGVNNYGTAYVT